MWPHLFIEGRRAVTGDGERPRYGLAFKKIFANGSKGIEQRAGLQADAAVHNPRPLIQRIAGADDARLLADGELELGGKHIGALFVRMVMHRADGAGGKIHLHGHHFAVVGQNAAGYAIAEVFKGGVFMKNKHRAILLLK